MQAPYFFTERRAKKLPLRVQFLLESLAALRAKIETKGGRLFLAQGKSVDVIPELARRLRVDRVSAYGWTEPSRHSQISVSREIHDKARFGKQGAPRTEQSEPQAPRSLP